MSRTDGVRRAARCSYWGEDEARVVVEAWRRSGDSLAEFCRRYEVDPQRVARWAKRLELAAGTLTFHPVALVPESRNDVPCFEVELERATIRVPAGFAVDDLRGILTALAERDGC